MLAGILRLKTISSLPTGPAGLETATAAVGTPVSPRPAAFRFLHNRIEEIRREAIAEHAGRQPRPPSLARLALANLAALALEG